MTLPLPLSVTALILCGGRGSRMGGVDKPLELFHGRPLVQHVLDRIAPQVHGRVLISANRHLDAYAQLGFPVLEDSLSDFQGPLAGLLSGMNHVARSLSGEAGMGSESGEGSQSGIGYERQVQVRHPDHWLLCVSGDSPWLPGDLLSRLAAAIPALSESGSPPSLHGSLHGSLDKSFDESLNGTSLDGSSLDRSSLAGFPGNALVSTTGGSPRPSLVADSAMAWGREAPDAPLRSQPLASLIHTRHRHALSDALARGERRVEAWLRTLPLAEVAFDRPEDANAFANINDRSQLERHPSAP